MTTDGYALLDSGAGRKLERIGELVIDRQAPGAFWRRRLPESRWRKADGIHHRSDTGGGSWEWRRSEPRDLGLSHGGLRFEIRPTPFGHLGVFAEQAPQWEWLRQALDGPERSGATPLRILNLFAYTGGSTLAAASRGAEVTHVDAAPGIVDWARRNAALNRLEDRPIRWIVEDCSRFIEREIKREKRYDGIVLDPPSFGRGKRGEVWKIEEDLPPLLEGLGRLCGPRPRLLLFSCHSPGFTPIVLDNLLRDHFDLAGGTLESGEMIVPEDGEGGRSLPAGTFARFLGAPEGGAP